MISNRTRESDRANSPIDVHIKDRDAHASLPNFILLLCAVPSPIVKANKFNFKLSLNIRDDDFDLCE